MDSGSNPEWQFLVWIILELKEDSSFSQNFTCKNFLKVLQFLNNI